MSKQNAIEKDLGIDLKKKQIKNTRNSFYIENESEKLKEEITAIAKHKGLTVTAMLRGMIIKLRDESPPEKRVWNKD